MSKHGKKIKLDKIKIIRLILFLIFILAAIFLIKSFFKKKEPDILSEIKIDKTQITETKTERMLKLEKLQEENAEIIGWLEIEGTKINYPVLQGEDNSFYMTHNYKKENSRDGAIFLDKDYDWNKPSTNLLIYGHNNRRSTEMFVDLINYKDESFYKEHPTIKFTTNKEDTEYEIIAVFYSRVYYKSEKNVFRYYYFIDAENEKEFNEYVENSKKASIYKTGKTARYGDQLLTLSTCDYSQKDGRFAVVARKVRTDRQ